MTIEIELVHEGRVIVQTFSDPLNMDEIAEAIVHHNEILDRSSKPVYTVVDALSLTKIPTNFLGNSKQFFTTTHPLAGQNIIVTSNAFFNVVIDLLLRVVPQTKIKMCKTMAEAWAEVDSILADEALS